MLLSTSRRLARALLLATIGLTACSSHDDAGGGGTVGPGSELAAFCTGTTITGIQALPSIGPGAWGGANNPMLPAGTTFLLGGSQSRYEGYVFLPDGRPAKMQGDFQKGIVKDVDFTTECSPSAAGAFVFLTAATIHASKDLSGAACVVPAGTRLSTHRFIGSGGDAASISSQDLVSRCGYADGFSKDLVYGLLIDK